MRRTLALALAVPAALLLLAPPPGVDDDTRLGDAHVGATLTRPDPASASGPVTTGTTTTGTTTTENGAPTADILAPRPGAEGEDTGPASSDGGGVAARSGPDGADGAAGTEEQRDGSPSGTPVPSPSGPAVETTFVVAPVPESGGVAGSGPRWRYSVEVEPSLGIDPATLAEEVRAALHDPRSWARTRTMEQVADPAQARIRVVLASPATVDELCGRVGLMTAGVYSCWNGRFAALNAWRWEVGADGFADITTYRTYLVNHEVGHGLGYGHVGCPGPGAVAPVMMQQSKGLDGCVANGWPTP